MDQDLYAMYMGRRHAWQLNGGNGNGNRKREMIVTAIGMQGQDKSSSSLSRSASLGRCKTWTLDWTHELTDIWTPDKAINDDICQPCPSSVQCTSGGFGDSE